MGFCDGDAEGGGEFCEFVEQTLGFRLFAAVEVCADEQRAFHHFRFIPDFKHGWNVGAGAVLVQRGDAGGGERGLWWGVGDGARSGVVGLPAAAEGFDEGDGGGEPAGGGSDEGAAGGEFFLLGVGDFEEVDETVAVAFEGKGGVAGGGIGAGALLLFDEAGAGLGGEGVFDFADGGEDGLTPVCGGFGVAGFGGGDAGIVGPAGEDGEVEFGAEGEGAAALGEEIGKCEAFEAETAVEFEGREGLADGDADVGAAGGERAFGFGDVGALAKERGGGVEGRFGDL